MSQSIVEKDNIQSPQPDPNEIWPLSGDDRGYPCVCVCSRRARAFVHRLSSVETCVSEGVSLEEQVRRIKDIEAIESDSFVPQAFKSSRDDVKVRPRPSFSPFLSLFSPSLIEFTSLHCHMPSVRRRPRPNQTFTWAPGVATRGGSIRRRGVRAPPERRKHKSSRRCSRAPSPRFSAHISRHFQQAQKEFTSFYCEASCQSPIPTQKLTRTAQTRIWDFNKKIIIKRRNTICCLRGIFHRCTPPLCPVLSCIGGRRPQTFSGSTRDLWSSVRSLGLFVPPLSETLPSPNWSAHPVYEELVDPHFFHMRVSTDESVNAQ